MHFKVCTTAAFVAIFALTMITVSRVIPSRGPITQPLRSQQRLETALTTSISFTANGECPTIVQRSVWQHPINGWISSPVMKGVLCPAVSAILITGRPATGKTSSE